VPHLEHVPAIALRPFERVIGCGSLICVGRFSRMQ